MKKECCILLHYAVRYGKNITLFLINVLSPYSGLTESRSAQFKRHYSWKIVQLYKT